MKPRELAAFLARRVARDPLARAIRDLARSTDVPTWIVGGLSVSRRPPMNPFVVHVA